jgi:hypothetical protein
MSLIIPKGTPIEFPLKKIIPKGDNNKEVLQHTDVK